jgi:2-iminobutanoate/2-iminopropanoate deaminase
VKDKGEHNMANHLRKIETDKAPAAIGPYSQAVIAGDILYTSGQVPIIPETGAVLDGDILAQAALVCENIGAILAAAGLDFSRVVKTTCFLADMADFAAFNSVYEKYFTEKPARSCVAVRTLPRNVLCEVEAIAYLQK